MNRFLTISFWVLTFLVLLILPVNIKKAYSCDSLCAAMLKVNPQGDVRLYEKISTEAQKYSHIVDPYVTVAIAFQESSLRQVTSASGRDVGLFQFSVDEIERRNIERDRLLTSVKYTFKQYALLMKEKKVLCADTYPDTWFACWLSKTPKHHKPYARKVQKHAEMFRLLAGDL